ncbi:hypothetical protein DY000_02009496 [Brassica cretica]|uniref:Secreted protein n=1 Tax=Brassica cretica TaxID=69181 RepID=A0ABQ7BXR6_BRACR|nr:hypothetical protein DY000_02009496 [Brassica cretica]
MLFRSLSSASFCVLTSLLLPPAKALCSLSMSPPHLLASGLFVRRPPPLVFRGRFQAPPLKPFGASFGCVFVRTACSYSLGRLR